MYTQDHIITTVTQTLEKNPNKKQNILYTKYSTRIVMDSFPVFCASPALSNRCHYSIARSHCYQWKEMKLRKERRTIFIQETLNLSMCANCKDNKKSFFFLAIVTYIK